MKVEDFAAWLSAISGMSEDQRREAMVALEKASVVGGAAAASAKKGGKRGRQEDALGKNAWRLRGVPIALAAKSFVGAFRMGFCGWLRGAHLQYADQDADGASAQEGPLARSRARRDDRKKGKSLAEPAALCGIHPTTAFRWRHRFLRAPASDKTRSLRGRNRRSGRNLPFSDHNKGRRVQPAEKGAKARRNGRRPQPSPGRRSHPRRPRPGTAPPRRDLGPGRRRFGETSPSPE